MDEQRQKRQKGTVIRWLLSALGYLLYTLVVLACLLWWKFPARTVKSWLEHRLNAETSGYAWNIDELKLVLPGRMQVSGITLTPVREKVPLLRIGQLELIPDPMRLLGSNRLLRYHMQVYGGTVAGSLAADPDFRRFDCRGKIAGLRVRRMTALQKSLQRKVSGTVNGGFSWRGGRGSSEKQAIKGKVIIGDGTVPLRKPVLGLAALPFSTIETPFTYGKGRWNIERGKIVSPKLTATFSGRVESAARLADFRLQFTGRLTPRTELFSGGNSRMVGIIRSFLKDGSLPFTVSGTMGEPGIHFANGLSEAMNRLQGTGR